MTAAVNSIALPGARLQATPTGLRDVLVLKPVTPDRNPPAQISNEQVQQDLMAASGQLVKFVEQRQTQLQKDELHGLHYHVPPHVHGTLLRVPKGAVFVAVVDIRKFSPAFGQSAGVELAEQNQHQLWVPPGLAVGIMGLSAESTVWHHNTGTYSAKHVRTIVWNDPDLCIAWPTTKKPTVSPADEKGKFFSWWSVPKDSTFGVSTLEGNSYFGS